MNKHTYICDYCHKPIKKEDYLVHLRYPKFDGIDEKYYHLRCYEKLQKHLNGEQINHISFEKWFRKNFCDSKGKPQVFISIYKNTLDFKNYCKMAWNKTDWKQGAKKEA